MENDFQKEICCAWGMWPALYSALERTSIIMGEGCAEFKSESSSVCLIWVSLEVLQAGNKQAVRPKKKISFIRQCYSYDA